MSEIISDKLFLGSYDDALDVDFLTRNEIQTIICVARELIVKSGNIKIYHFPIDEYPNSNIHEYFDPIADLIKTTKNVFVHCLAGINRSPAIVIAFLVKHQNMSPDEAFLYIKQIRDEIDIDPDFMVRLKKYHSRIVLQRKQEVHQSLSRDTNLCKYLVD